VCDLFGAVCATLVLGENAWTTVKTLEASALAVHHLRLLQMVDDLVESPTDSEQSVAHTFDSQARLWALRLLLSGVLEALAQRRTAYFARGIYRRITKLNQLHGAVVSDQVMFFLLDRYREFLADPTGADPM
jgi:hypothetical protein